MKKLVVAATAVILGIAANAASCNWQVKSDWVSADGENPLTAQVYAFDALAYSFSTITDALANNDTSVLANALAAGAVDMDGAFLFAGNGISDDGATPPYASVYAIIVATDASENAYFYSTDTKSVKLTDAVMADKATFVWDEIATGAVGGSGWTAMSVPEPTSGLLMLLGVAGLALKRKRA
jgi:hypothetical protein